MKKIFCVILLALVIVGKLYSQTEWTTQTLIPQSYYFADIQFYNSLIGWAVGKSGGIYYTIDGGNNWVVQNSGVTNSLKCLSIINDSICWIGGSQGLVLLTLDAGNNWVVKNTGNTHDINSIKFFNTKKGWFAGDNGIIKTTYDGGNNWINQISNTIYNIYDIFFTDSLNGWAVGKNTVLHTVNGGSYWKLAHLTSEQFAYNSVFFTDINNGWLVGEVGKSSTMGAGYIFTGAVYKTRDGGNTWVIPLRPSEKIRDVFFLDKDTGWVVGDVYSHSKLPYQHIYYTDNGGYSWTYQEVQKDTSNAYDDILSIYCVNSFGWAVRGNLKYGSILHINNNKIKGEVARWHIPDRAYPNPFQDYTTIRFPNEGGSEHSLFLYNSLGEIVTMINNISSNNVVIYKNNLSCGIYFFRLINESTLIAEGKIIVE